MSIRLNLPKFTADEIRRRFSDSVDIRNADAFTAELMVLFQECLESIGLPSSVEIQTQKHVIHEILARKASALRTDTRWIAGNTEIQRGRAIQLDVFEQPHNLALPVFANLANKSRQQIYKDIDARRLLALSVGRRGQKLPDWQLDPIKQRLTQFVLQKATAVDNWTLYHALSDPLEGLAGRSPIEAVSAGSMEAVTNAVFNVLGMHFK